jgi:tetratricopeptide (TPR) repeat protein
LMLALTLGGERSAALAQYEACRRLLAEELGCEPEDETQALYARIRTGTLSLSAPPSLRASAPVPSEGEGYPPRPRFVVREQELARLGNLLERALTGQGGVALIAGEAGSGKTALLQEFAQRASGANKNLIALRGRCNAYGGAGDPYLPFREMLQTLAGDVEAKRAGGTLSPEQARRVWDALPVVGAALVEHGPSLIGTFVPGEALLRRAEGFSSPQTGRPSGAERPHGRWPSGQGWQARLRDMVQDTGEAVTPTPQPDLFAQVTQVLHIVSLGWPLLLAIDDLQWADGSTAALLFHLGRRLAGSRILLVCAYRPETLQAADLGGLSDPRGLRSVLHELAREWGEVVVDLDQADGPGFVEAYVDAEPNCLGAAFRRALYDHTGGNPLFTVELLRSFEREGALRRDEAGRWIESAGLNWDRMPPQVEAVISEHLDGLSDEDRALLQAASAQGEQFIAEVAARVLGRDEENVIERLSGPLRVRHRLVEADRLERLASSGQRLSRYRFRHALLQRSAYGSLDVVARSRLHEATARALQAIYALPTGQAEAEQAPPEVSGQAQTLALALARHYEAAGLPLEAARALHDAGCQAMALSAYREAFYHFDHGLALLADVPPSPEHLETERLLRVARLIPQRSLVGTASSEVEGALARARQTGAGEAQGRTRLMTLDAEAGYLVSRGLLEDALRVAEEMRELATQEGDEGAVAHAKFWFGFVHNLMGEPLKAVSHFDWIFARQIAGEARLRAAVGYDITSHALTFSGINQWFLGEPEQALRRSTRAVTRALEMGDLLGQAFASACGSTTLFLLRSDAAALQERAELCQRVCEEEGLAQWHHFADVFLGWLAVTRGEDLAGIERMQSAMAAWQDAGMVVGSDALVVVLADGCLAATNRHPTDDKEGRTRLLAIGLAAVERWIGPDVPCGQAYQPELHRLRGELLLARNGLAAAGEALACFERAMQIGAEQGALAWELRATMSLVRLRQNQGQAFAAELAKARQCLRKVYGRFTEGFAFPDLQEAAALIGGVG